MASSVVMKAAGFRTLCRALALAAALAAAGLVSGCVAIVAAGAGGGTVAYLRGDLEATLGAGMDRTGRAVNRAVDELRFTRVSENRDALLAITIARNAEDRRIEIRQERLGEHLTRVRIRVGLFGDETVSRALLERIQAGL